MAKTHCMWWTTQHVHITAVTVKSSKQKHCGLCWLTVVLQACLSPNHFLELYVGCIDLLIGQLTNMLTHVHVYRGWSDITESIVTIQLPFCGVKGRRFIALFKLHSIRWFMKMSVWSVARQQSVFQRYHSEKHLPEFYPQDGSKSQLASKLRHCHPMY